MTAKEKLKQLLESMENKSKNLKLLQDHFGEKNLSKLKFDIITIKLGTPNSWDGQNYLDVDFKNGKCQRYCDVADIDSNYELKKDDLPNIELNLFEKLKNE